MISIRELRSCLRPGLSAAAVTAGVFAALVLGGTPAQAASAPPEIRIVSDAEGSKLQVDGRDFMVCGMNWGYIPIGHNYSYNLWAQPDDVIQAALDREMSLLEAMGVNTIKQLAGVPPRWVRYIYERYGILTVLNHQMARYGFNLDGTWIPNVDYADPRLRAAVKAEILAMVEEYRDTPGVLMWLLGNENNYGLSWTSFEAEALPEGERDEARARQLYSLFGDITRSIKEIDPHRPVAIANGDLQYIDLIAQECKELDVLGTNVYRGISVQAGRSGLDRHGPLFDVVKAKLGIPVLYTEFGADAWNAKLMREDQAAQARYLIGQWKEIYEQSYGKGGAGNAIGGLVFQWSDGWWKFRQDENLDVHDTHASWPNAGYPEDYVEGENNMNEEWWGICAKGPPDERGLFDLYPRAAYYALRRVFAMNPYAPNVDLQAIRDHFAGIQARTAVRTARADRALLLAEGMNRVKMSGLRVELETYSTGGARTSTPENPPSTGTGPEGPRPAFQGFDHLESFYADFQANPAENVTGTVSLNVLGNIPENPIDEIFYENRGVILSAPGGNDFLLDRAKVYRAEVTWNDRWFDLHGFYRAGHFHWGYEGDFFGLYREAYYGENVDIYNSDVPIGVEIHGKKSLNGLAFAMGRELWWGANPALMLKYRRAVKGLDATLIYQEDISRSPTHVSGASIFPVPPVRKATLQVEGARGPWGFEVGGIWSSNSKLDQTFQVFEDEGAGPRILQDHVKVSDLFGTKAKLTYQSGRWNWYAQAAYMGIVADAGPTPVLTFTGWSLKDSGFGNQSNILTGLAVNLGTVQVAPNFLYQKPLVGPMPADAPPPGRARNVSVLGDPFAVRENRETLGLELLLTYDPTPTTWFWMWDSDVREDAPFAASLDLVYKDHKTTADAATQVLADGLTPFAFPGGTPPRELFEVTARIVSNLSPRARLVAQLYGGTGEPVGDDSRLIHRYGLNGRLTYGPIAFESFVKIDDWGPYDYHRDFNLTFPLQLMGDLSHSLGSPRWFGFPQTRIGVRGTFRTLDSFSPRYCPDFVVGPTGVLECDPLARGEEGREWEIRTYLHLSL